MDEKKLAVKVYEYGMREVSRTIRVHKSGLDPAISDELNTRIIASAYVAVLFSHRVLKTPATWWDHFKVHHEERWWMRWFSNPCWITHHAMAFFPGVPIADMPYRATGSKFVIHTCDNIPRI